MFNSAKHTPYISICWCPCSPTSSSKRYDESTITKWDFTRAWKIARCSRPGRPWPTNVIPPLIDMCLPETGVYIPKNIPKLFFYAI